MPKADSTWPAAACATATMAALPCSSLPSGSLDTSRTLCRVHLDRQRSLTNAGHAGTPTPIDPWGSEWEQRVGTTTGGRRSLPAI
jgi:hypothetical protein